MGRGRVRTAAALAFGWALALGLSFAAHAEDGVRIDLNEASVEELCGLPGVGPKRAEAIVEKRQRRPFTRVSQLLEVKGIGHKTLVRLKPLVFVGKRGRVQSPRPHPLLQGAPPDADGGAPEPDG